MRHYTAPHINAHLKYNSTIGPSGGDITAARGLPIWVTWGRAWFAREFSFFYRYIPCG